MIKLVPVDPRLELVRLPEEPRAEAEVLPFPVDPDMSLNRLVVPRVAPMLERGVAAAPAAEASGVPEEPEESPEGLVPLLELLLLAVPALGWAGAVSVLPEPPEDPPLEEPPPPIEPPRPKDRPRSLRLPRIWGAMIEANFSAWTVPLMRIVRWRSPTTIPAVRVTATVFCAVGLADCVFQ